MADGKQELRRKLKSRRAGLSLEEARAKGAQIVQRALANIDLGSIKTMHAYWPLAGQREADTRQLFEAIWRKYPGVKTATWQKPGMAVWVSSGPVKKPVSPRQKYDLIIVPVIGFNAGRQRLGFGGGFYDRFLAGQTRALKAGLAYDFGLCEFEPESHDIPLDVIVTEKRVFRTG